MIVKDICKSSTNVTTFFQEFVEPPSYSSGFYSSDHCKPNDSEWCIFRRFQQHQAYPPTVREAVRDVKEGEAVQDTEGKKGIGKKSLYRSQVGHQCRRLSQFL